MSVMIICPGCGTESDYREVMDSDNPQCTICGKMLLAEVLAKKQAMENGEIEIDNMPNRQSSRKMGEKLSKLDDDDLFGELEPFDLEDQPTGGLRPESEKDLQEIKGGIASETTESTPNMEENYDDIELDEDEKFENPMEKSNLMKKIKDDHDLFGNLDD